MEESDLCSQEDFRRQVARRVLFEARDDVGPFLDIIHIARPIGDGAIGPDREHLVDEDIASAAGPDLDEEEMILELPKIFVEWVALSKAAGEEECAGLRKSASM